MRVAWYGRGAFVFSAFGAIAALVPALAMWGFTVDDALIPVRYAHHLATGAGYRFNAAGPSTDGVTPLPWAILLAPLAGSDDLLVGLFRAKVLGVVAWTSAGALLGAALPRRWSGVMALALVALAFPVGAWAASGMETGLATALATIAAVSHARSWRAALLAGLAATLRPELVVWAVILAGGAAIASARRPRTIAATVTLAFAPFALCAGVRLALFGRVVPLAVLAKPSDAAHGMAYAGAATLVVLMPLAVLAPIAARRASARARTLLVALLAHAVVVVAVGGDWMPYARLLVPIAPGLALAFVDLAEVAHRAATWGRALVASGLGVALLSGAAPAGRRVYADRNALVVRARPLLDLPGTRVVAALDIGWVGAATGAELVDLAGLTDPAIASLRGGHTSKAVDVAMLLDRGVDTVVLYGRPRAVEQRLLGSPLFAERFERAAELPLGDRGASYAVYRRRPR